VEDLADIEECTQGNQQFGGTLKTGEIVQFVPIKSADKYRLLCTYTTLSGSLNIQRLFGVFTNTHGEYAVMEDLQGERVPFVRLNSAFSENSKTSVASASRIQRLRLCYEIAVAVAYLHSVSYVVKTISDSSIFIRKVDKDLIPVLTNIKDPRLVYSVLKTG
jgi:serine/threonine protein kinase